MPRVSITLSSDWTAAYAVVNGHVVLRDIEHDGLHVPWADLPADIETILRDSAREAHNLDLADVKADQGDFRREQKEDGD